MASYQFSVDSLNEFERNRYTFLSLKQNIKTNKFALQLKEQVTNEQAFYNALLAYFVEQNFTYTLTPTPMSGDNTLDH